MSIFARDEGGLRRRQTRAITLEEARRRRPASTRQQRRDRSHNLDAREHKNALQHRRRQTTQSRQRPGATRAGCAPTTARQGRCGASCGACHSQPHNSRERRSATYCRRATCSESHSAWLTRPCDGGAGASCISARATQCVRCGSNDSDRRREYALSDSVSCTESAVRSCWTASSYCCREKGGECVSKTWLREWATSAHPSVHTRNGKVVPRADIARIEVERGRVVLLGEIRLARVGVRGAEAVVQKRVL